MAERLPPVPPAGRSKKVPGETERLPKELGPGKGKEPRDPAFRPAESDSRSKAPARAADQSRQEQGVGRRRAGHASRA